MRFKKKMVIREDIGGCWRWELGAGLKGEGDQKVKASSFKAISPWNVIYTVFMIVIHVA